MSHGIKCVIVVSGTILNENVAIKERNDLKQKAAQVANLEWNKERQKIKAKYQRWSDRVEEYSKWRNNDVNDIFWTECSPRPGTDLTSCWADLAKDNAIYIVEAHKKNLPYADNYYDTGHRNTDGCETLGLLDWNRGPPECVYTQRRRCARSQKSIDNANTDWIKNKPLQDISLPEPKYGITGPYDDEPYIENDANIQCCSNFINMSNGDATNISQSCSQQIDQLIQQIKVESPVLIPDQITEPTPDQITEIITTPIQGQGNGSTKETWFQIFDNSWIYPLIIVVCFLILSFIITSSSFLLLKRKIQ
jgi:hypothetical protein